MKRYTAEEGQGFCGVCGEVFVPTENPEEEVFCYVSCSHPEHNTGYVFEACEENARLREGFNFI